MADIDSYYVASAGPRPEHAALRGDLDCDVAVIGAGITGVSAALHLAERGYAVAVLESQRVGAGASGRSGGQILPGFGCSPAQLLRLAPASDARRLWALSREAVRDTRAAVVRHAIDCDWREGHVDVALKARQRDELLATRALLAGEFADESCEFLEGPALARVIASPRYCAGLYDGEAGHLHPLNYTLGLARAAIAAGVRIFEHTTVRRIEHGSTPVAWCEAGAVRARYLVLAVNTGMYELVPELGRKIMPVGTYIVSTAALDESRAVQLLPTDAGVCDINFVLDYFRRSADHRLLFGGRVSYSGVVPPRLAQSMRSRMLRVFPTLSDVAIEHVWGGDVDISTNRAPHFGCLGGTVFYAQGFSGHGMALTGLAGRLIAEALAGQAERFDVFARLQHRDFPGGRALRMPALVLATLYYRLRDLL